MGVLLTGVVREMGLNTFISLHPNKKEGQKELR
jgi:hypothetical protein